ncbi:peptidoglycan/LPS O-acetylase OafA/YrhL [Chitinophaga dinghuensis]|uniref:Peptidoglycan/LPS O-acetylase OafA/YrhL n=2 Tax=Chitinophaga dinghuensis TaxID=1539050 RepID=A0A327WEI7_9BACT|nr:peptidoglycan/LPS O-acetylase OafA/YrhL [Chitinophaga dinghuensis]
MPSKTEHAIKHSEFLNKAHTSSYRKDIDGLRAIAVLAVIVFHFGYLPNGYLGVDIFFVISGYLITKIVYNETLKNEFSVLKFYLRRIRRIIPLVLFTSSVALIIGLLVMLPDDLENLSQSIVATNFFANNILLLITSRDYWNTVNEFKPLMHTWSLAVEEQFYLFFPVIFLVFSGKKIKWILPLLIGLTIISLALYLFGTDSSKAFYCIQYRFFELSIGGIAAILFSNKSISGWYKLVLFAIIIPILLFDLGLSQKVQLLLIVAASTIMLLPSDGKQKPVAFLMENKIMMAIGKISFSLYMWHQIIIAYSRYFVFEKITVTDTLILSIIIVILSIFSYYLIEQPFRNKSIVKNSTLLFITGTLFIITTASSLFLYRKAGIIRDVPELDIYSSTITNNFSFSGYKRNAHIEYNAAVYDLDKNFTQSDKIKVLVIGNSFARDWVNVLQESKYAGKIEISYATDFNSAKDLAARISQSQYIFFSCLPKKDFDSLSLRWNIQASKCWNIGTKQFGANNGIIYNRRGNSDYCSQRINVADDINQENIKFKQEWGNKFIDLLGLATDSTGKIPVFTPNCKFISQDCAHLTKEGAKYFAQLLNNNPTINIFEGK